MPAPALLNNVEHKDLRILTRRGADLGDAVMSAITFPAEFRSVQACYPIVFGQTDEAPGFQPLALFGFEEGDNLFLDGERWDASYIPLTVERQPFLIGVDGDKLMVHVDMDHPRVSRSEGELVFLPHGGTTEFLENVNGKLFSIHQGVQSTHAFVAALVQHQLLESFVLDVQLDDGTQGRMAGFHTIDEDRLNALPGAALEELQRAGHLTAIYMVLASLSHFRDLIERMNRRHANGR